MEATNSDKLVLIGIQTFKSYDEMYKVVSFLNRTLKGKKLVFGFTKDTTRDTMTISIYEC